LKISTEPGFSPGSFVEKLLVILFVFYPYKAKESGIAQQALFVVETIIKLPIIRSLIRFVTKKRPGEIYPGAFLIRRVSKESKTAFLV